MISRPAPEPPLVLVVDDFADNREMYAEYLAFLGYRVAQAVNGQEAVDMALAGRPDAIVMDLSLPVIDGWEATRRLKSDPRTKAIPILALSGHVLRGAETTALRAGADAFIAKPCLPEVLADRIRDVIEAARGVA
jgi:two-component system, cell cycle response regulator DivK